jgi:hypothetical protein
MSKKTGALQKAIPRPQKHRRSYWLLTALSAFFLIMIGGCSNSINGLSGMSLSSLGMFGSPAAGGGGEVVLSRDPASLANGTAVEKSIYNAVELSRQKRFAEARVLLVDLREIQPKDSESYQAITCAMALLALREGDIATFRRSARQLDKALGHPVRVEPSFVEVVSLYRIISFQSLPVNAPEGMKGFYAKYFHDRNKKPASEV